MEMAKIVKNQEVVWSGINEICLRMGRQECLTVLNYRRDLNFPMRKDGGIWICVEAEVLAWAKDLGITDLRNVDHSAIFKLVRRRARSGPGQVIRGDINSICEKLRVSTNVLFVAQGRVDNPFRKIEGSNEYEVDLNRWQDYVEDTNFR
jgi:hypothetical protein